MVLERCSKKPPVREGYILLVVMAVLIAIVTALSSLATITLQRGRSAADGLRRLQNEWATKSIETVLLDNAATIFKRREDAIIERLRVEGASTAQPPPPPPPWMAETILLSGVRYDVRLDDEDSKANLNLNYHQGSRDAVESWLASKSGLPQAIRLLPAVPSMPERSVDSAGNRDPTIDDELDDSPEDDLSEDGSLEDDFAAAADAALRPRAFRSWGEVLDLPLLRQIAGRDALPAIAASVTFVGGDSLNIARADDQAIEATAALVLGEPGAKRFLSRYRQNQNLAIQAILQTEVSIPRQRGELAKLFGKTSGRFSLWIDATSPHIHRRTWHVSRMVEDGLIYREMFSF